MSDLARLAGQLNDTTPTTTIQATPTPPKQKPVERTVDTSIPVPSPAAVYTDKWYYHSNLVQAVTFLTLVSLFIIIDHLPPQTKPEASEIYLIVNGLIAAAVFAGIAYIAFKVVEEFTDRARNNQIRKTLENAYGLKISHVLRTVEGYTITTLESGGDNTWHTRDQRVYEHGTHLYLGEILDEGDNR